MPKAYWIAHVDIHDNETYAKYKEANAIAFAKYGARFVVRGGEQTIEAVSYTHLRAHETN